jgi:peptidoglycan/xylan/chitin deacetylase (PgdA/CDA1 family)
MGQTGPTGPIFLPDDIGPLLARGHELGCHTFAHCHSWETPTRAFLRSVERNASELGGLSPRTTFETFSYPISPPRPATKRATAARFACCRGGGQTFNEGTADLAYLNAYFLEKDRQRPEAIERTIDANCRAKGWLILATHDVCVDPTPYGCTPAVFERIVRYASKSGARILPVVDVVRTLSGQTPSDFATDASPQAPPR